VDRWWHLSRMRFRALVRRTRVERDLDRELAFHLQKQIEENIARGMSFDDARYAAKRALDGVTEIKEECRDMRRLNQIETILNDLRYAFRTLARTPGFTAIIVLTLALAIGANTAIFSVIEGVLLRPLPYARPDRIVRIFLDSAAYPKFPLNPFDLRDFRMRNRSFESIAGIYRSDVQLSGSGEPVLLHAFQVTAGYFHVLGFTPARGREFTTEDEHPDIRLAILSDRLWRTHFQSDPGIVGRNITLDAQPYQVVGIIPPGVQHPGNDYHAIADGDTVDLWIPFPFQGDPNRRGSHYMEGIARLKPGVSPEQAGTDLNSIMAQLAKEHEAAKGWRVYLVPLYKEIVGSTQRMLFVLLGAVGLLLLIACVNAANLLLARSSARVREIAVRSALGAARSRIVRQLLTESIVIALAGAILGGVLAVGGVQTLVALLPAGFPRASGIHLDAGVFAFTLLIAVLTGLLFGLAPALTASRADLQQNLREGGPNASSSSRNLRLRNFLVIGETGLACVLLIAAGLMLHSFVNLLNADPGFRPQQLLTASISLPFKNYSKDPILFEFYNRLLPALEAIPGVRSAGLGSDLPWTGYDENISGFNLEGKSNEFNDKTSARFHGASVDYFRALGIPLIRGRYFTAQDTEKAPLVMIVNDVMAQRYWPGEDPLGKRIAFTDKPTEKDWIRVVGVVGDIKDHPDSAAAKNAFWGSMMQQTGSFNNFSLVLRASGEPAQLTNAARSVIHQIDPGLAVSEIRSMEQITEASVAQQKFSLFLVGLFAALALVLATIGIYGVISYSVSQRMHEFGMRMALGARPWDLTRMVLSQGMRLSVIGAAAGLLAAAGVARLLGSLLYGVKTTDPVTFGAVAVLALVTAFVACFLPARRATAANPIGLLRSQ
jgi:predicted permease